MSSSAQRRRSRDARLGRAIPMRSTSLTCRSVRQLDRGGRRGGGSNGPDLGRGRHRALRSRQNDSRGPPRRDRQGAEPGDSKAAQEREHDNAGTPHRLAAKPRREASQAEHDQSADRPVGQPAPGENIPVHLTCPPSFGRFMTRSNVWSVECQLSVGTHSAVHVTPASCSTASTATATTRLIGPPPWVPSVPARRSPPRSSPRAGKACGWPPRNRRPRPRRSPPCRAASGMSGNGRRTARPG